MNVFNYWCILKLSKWFSLCTIFFVKLDQLFYYRPTFFALSWLNYLSHCENFSIIWMAFDHLDLQKITSHSFHNGSNFGLKMDISCVFNWKLQTFMDFFIRWSAFILFFTNFSNIQIFLRFLSISNSFLQIKIGYGLDTVLNYWKQIGYGYRISFSTIEHSNSEYPNQFYPYSNQSGYKSDTLFWLLKTDRIHLLISFIREGFEFFSHSFDYGNVNEKKFEKNMQKKRAIPVIGNNVIKCMRWK